MFQVLAVISVILFLIAAPPYIIDTLHGTTRPERASWFIFLVLNLTAFVANITLGASWSLVFLGLDTMGSLIVFSMSLKYGVGGWTRLDRAALAIAAIGVAVSFIAREPVIALIGVILADAAGTVPTIFKTFAEPGSETTISWLLTGTGAVCGLLSVGKFDVPLLLYPAYLTLANYAIPVTQFVSGRLKRAAP